MSNKGCNYSNTPDGKPHCKKNKSGVMDPRCHIPKKNCRVNKKSPFLTNEDREELSSVSAATPVVQETVSVEEAAAAEPVIVSSDYKWFCQCGYENLASDGSCNMCEGPKEKKRFDGYLEPWICLRCFQQNQASAPGVGCINCGESNIILPNQHNLRRAVKACDSEYCNEIQINSWCFKHAINNLIQRHKYFVGEFDGRIYHHGQINVMGICKLKTSENLPIFYPGRDISLTNANNLLELCDSTVNVSTVTAIKAIELGGYTSTEIFNEYGDIDTKISEITPEFLENPQLIGFLLRVSLQEGDANTNHFTSLRKDADCPNMFRYIESRPNEADKPGPWTECLNVDVGVGVVKSFLNQYSSRIKSIIAVFKRQ